MSILSKLFNPPNPADSAMPYLNQIPGVGHEYYDPFINRGRNAGETVSGQYETLTHDPVALINSIMKSYQPSEGYEFNKNLLKKEMANTAAAGGIAGTPFDQLNQAQNIKGLLSQDQQQFLQNALGLYHTGLEGEQGIENKGFASSNAIADLLGGSLNQRGGLAFQGQQEQNKSKTDLLHSLIMALTTGAGAYFGGPFGRSIAGPMSGTSTAPWNNPGGIEYGN
jgi:hypothetical protein